MREIKFRGRRTDNGEWVYFNLQGAYIDENGNEISPKKFIRDCGFKVDPKTVGQYSGLKDSKGNEVYEGDILGDDTVVEYGFQNCSCCSKVFGWDFGSSYISDASLDVEVIGNIYEHPHLLEEEQA